MKKEELNTILESVDIPDIDMHRHKKILRSALLSSSHFRHASANRFFGVPDYFFRITHSDTHNIMSSKKSFAFSGALVALVAVAVFGFSKFGGGGAAYAHAQQMVQAAQVQAFKISSEMRADLESTMKVSMADTLKEAHAAANLRTMTEDEYRKSGAANFTIAPIGSQPKSWSAPVTYLSYTNPQGKNVILGLDKDNLLVMTIQETSSGMVNVTGPLLQDPTENNN